MSKKKAFGGNTMTLKDFHGGSIPADISLPSAPGVIVRPTDRPVFDRQNTWGNSMGVRSDLRLRPSSSGSVRNLDDNKTPFLTGTVNIGRNFDEDERKPLDGGASAPRRTVTDESFGASVVRSEPRGDSGRLSGQPSLGPVAPQMGGVSGTSYSARVVEGGSQSVVGYGASVSSRPNAWGVKKEARGMAEPGSSLLSGQSTVSKFAQASALDKISSGRWQTKPVQHQVEVIRPLDSPNSLYARESDSYIGGVNFTSEREYYDNTLVRHVERGLAIEEGVRGGFKEGPGIENVHSPVQSSVVFTNEGQPAYPDAKLGSFELQQPPEVSERPKLKLLPRTKPLDVQEASGVDHRQGSEQPIDTSHSEAGSMHGNASHVIARPSSTEASHGKPVASGSEAVQQHVERPKLNLKPRSHPVDHFDANREKERSLFGGARPREMVLKERGVDDVVTSPDEVKGPSRIKNDGPPRGEVVPAHANTSRQGDNLSSDQRTGRGHEKRDQRADNQRADVQRKNWRNDNWRNGRDTEKHQQERQPSPETWRKPVEQPNSNNSGLRFGKAVSAADLAQAFSRSGSSAKPVDQFSGQKGIPGQKGLPVRSQIPFSRLTGPTTRPQINGY